MLVRGTCIRWLFHGVLYVLYKVYVSNGSQKKSMLKDLYVNGKRIISNLRDQLNICIYPNSHVDLYNVFFV